MITGFLSKVCFKCNKNKPFEKFYKHKGMKDGRLNKCIECARKDVSERYYLLSEDEEYMKKQRERGREKYARLGYKDRIVTKFYRTSKYKNQHRDLNTEKGLCNHHWSYNENDFSDVIKLDRKTHRRIHKHIFLDIDSKYFKDDKGVLLDSKEKHIGYLLSKGFNF